MNFLQIKFSVKNKFKKDEKSCWQSEKDLLYWYSCRENDNESRKWRTSYEVTCTDPSEARRCWNLDNWTVNKPWKIQWELFSSHESGCELLWNFKEPLKTVNSDLRNEQQARCSGKIKFLTWEFDPGSGWTLAACLTHASRTKRFNGSFRMEVKLTEWRTGE